MTGHKAEDMAAAVKGPALRLDFSGAGSLRTIAMAAGDMRIIVEAEVRKVLEEHDRNPVDACKVGLARLQADGGISAAEAGILGRICVLVYQRQRGHLDDEEAADRIIGLYQSLVVDPNSSPAAIAIASVGASFVGSGKPARPLSASAATAAGNMGFIGGAIVGAGIGLGIGGPGGAAIGGFIGAVVGTVAGACSEM